jgi:CRISPR/Cas system-associated exonuclease Cas4 (RecB family)
MLLPSISQQHLQLWTTCRRKFCHTFLDEINLPVAHELVEKLTLGKQFHLLVQQHQLDMDVSQMYTADSTLCQWFQSYLEHPPQMITGQKFAEHKRSVRFNGTTLTAVYDLVILGNVSAQIIDWKTHQNPVPLPILAEQWQTKLYLFILRETTSYAPEQISMTYWFANALPNCKTVTIPYSASQHQAIARTLHNILHEMAEEDSYPPLPLDSKPCRYCEFLERCQGETTNTSLPEFNLADIPEVAI